MKSTNYTKEQTSTTLLYASLVQIKLTKALVSSYVQDSFRVVRLTWKSKQIKSSLRKYLIYSKQSK